MAVLLTRSEYIAFFLRLFLSRAHLSEIVLWFKMSGRQEMLIVPAISAERTCFSKNTALVDRQQLTHVFNMQVFSLLLQAVLVFRDSRKQPLVGVR